MLLKMLEPACQSLNKRVVYYTYDNTRERNPEEGVKWKKQKKKEKFKLGWGR